MLGTGVGRLQNGRRNPSAIRHWTSSVGLAVRSMSAKRLYRIPWWLHPTSRLRAAILSTSAVPHRRPRRARRSRMKIRPAGRSPRSAPIRLRSGASLTASAIFAPAGPMSGRLHVRTLSLRQHVRPWIRPPTVSGNLSAVSRPMTRAVHTATAIYRCTGAAGETPWAKPR